VDGVVTAADGLRPSRTRALTHTAHRPLCPVINLRGPRLAGRLHRTGTTVRLITRNDASLAIGLIVSALVIFQRPLHLLLSVAQGIEGRYHLDLVPALTLMVVLFVFHQYRKRHLANAEARAAEAEAARARVRSEELERL